MDIEDLGKLGKKHGGCPYYAARAAVADADVSSVCPTVCGRVSRGVCVWPQIVLMPYTTLLHLSTRESYGFTPDVLQRCVVILDEGHNVIDAINGMHSCSVTLPQVT